MGKPSERTSSKVSNSKTEGYDDHSASAKVQRSIFVLVGMDVNLAQSSTVVNCKKWHGYNEYIISRHGLVC